MNDVALKIEGDECFPEPEYLVVIDMSKCIVKSPVIEFKAFRFCGKR
jgi:hypothetical protein